MSSRPDIEVVTQKLLRSWQLPEVGSSKYSRGNVLVVGGARFSPGAVLLGGLAALRVGAGRLTLAVAESVAVPLAVEVPESGVRGLPETSAGAVRGAGVGKLIEKELGRADAVLIGGGLDDPDEAAALLADVVPHIRDETPVILDAFALGVLGGLPDVVDALRGRLLLTPNEEEADRLLDGDAGDPEEVAPRLADRYGAVVTVRGQVAAPDGRRWEISTGYQGLATSGSGDVLAGALGGLLARGADPAQAACWATHLHAAAGDRLIGEVGRLGFLARELVNRLPVVLAELDI